MAKLKTPKIVGKRSTTSTAGNTDKDLPSKKKAGKTRANSPWRYQHHYFKWGWSRELDWFPILGCLQLTFGCSNLSNAGQIPAVINERIQKGWTVIDLNDNRLGPYTNYIQSFTIKGGLHWKSIFHNPDILGDEVDWVRDDEAYADFLKHIVESGIISPISDLAKRRCISKQRRITDKLYGDLYNDPSKHMLEVRYKTELRKLYGMEGMSIEDAEKRIEEEVSNVTSAGK